MLPRGERAEGYSAASSPPTTSHTLPAVVGGTLPVGHMTSPAPEANERGTEKLPIASVDAPDPSTEVADTHTASPAGQRVPLTADLMTPSSAIPMNSPPSRWLVLGALLVVGLGVWWRLSADEDPPPVVDVTPAPPEMVRPAGPEAVLTPAPIDSAGSWLREAAITEMVIPPATPIKSAVLRGVPLTPKASVASAPDSTPIPTPALAAAQPAPRALSPAHRRISTKPPRKSPASAPVSSPRAADRPGKRGMMPEMPASGL